MTPLNHMRLGWIVTLVSIAAGIFIQATTGAFGFYRVLHVKADVSTKVVMIWPNLIPLFLAIAAGVFLIFLGYCRVVRERGAFKDPW